MPTYDGQGQVGVLFPQEKGRREALGGFKTQNRRSAISNLQFYVAASSNVANFRWGGPRIDFHFHFTFALRSTALTDIHRRAWSLLLPARHLSKRPISGHIHFRQQLIGHMRFQVTLNIRNKFLSNHQNSKMSAISVRKSRGIKVFKFQQQACWLMMSVSYPARIAVDIVAATERKRLTSIEQFSGCVRPMCADVFFLPPHPDTLFEQFEFTVIVNAIVLFVNLRSNRRKEWGKSWEAQELRD